MAKWLIPILLMCSVAFAKDKPDPRLSAVKNVFVQGNNQAAEKAREVLAHGKTCLSLATKAADADAVLDVATDTQSQGQAFGPMGGTNWIANATLTLKSGDLVWSKSERFSDAPFRSGGKVAGELLIKDLVKVSGCKDR